MKENMQNKNWKVARIQFRYYEKAEMVWPIFLKVLKQIGWIDNIKELYQNKIIKIREGKHKVIHAQIKEIQEFNLLEFVINKKEVGKQLFSFNFFTNKKALILEISTQIEWNNDFSKKEIKTNYRIAINAFKSNFKKIDGLIRDEMERQNLKAFF